MNRRGFLRALAATATSVVFSKKLPAQEKETVSTEILLEETTTLSQWEADTATGLISGTAEFFAGDTVSKGFVVTVNEADLIVPYQSDSDVPIGIALKNAQNQDGIFVALN